MNLLSALRARRFEIRRALENTPLVGPALLTAIRRGRRLWREYHPSPPPINPERFKARYAKLSEIDDLDIITDPVKQLHATFALSTVTRGRTVVDRMKSVTNIRGKSYLDVGCAYGGFLVAFAEAGAKRIVGIDIDPGFLDCARALLEDYSLRADVRRMDLLDAGPSSDLGRFELITCNDVIEHVVDPAAALARLGALLSEDGTLYMEIPNRWSAPFVLSDGHYRVFGLTVLPKKTADQYAEEAIKARQDVTYKSLPFYINTLAKLGYSCRLADGTPSDLPARFGRLAAIFKECERKVEGDIPHASPESKRSLVLHVRRTARAFHRGHETYRNLLATDRAAADRFGERLFRAFGLDFWTIYVERRPSRARLVSWSREMG